MLAPEDKKPTAAIVYYKNKDGGRMKQRGRHQ
jgi:hypothetical protein